VQAVELEPGLIINIATIIYSLGASEKQDATGIFWDNDSLAALLALELKADLLILLSDVEGLYTGPPSEPKSQLIHTYLKEKHDDMVTFGEKSRVGRGGMTAKVYAAWNAASAGIPVVITR
jgi:delta-1-pyrroline-5-carboxylate synthetase